MLSDKLSWWKSAKFGMFIHWGIYSMLGGEWQGQKMAYIGEWIMSKYRIPICEYEKVAKEFNPIKFDAEEWVLLAKNAGMKYIIFTAKHHDGFAMFKSSYSNYNIYDFTNYKIDIVKELAHQCKKHHIRLCLYYSQALDWHEENAGGYEKGLPKNFSMSWCNDWDFPQSEKKDFSIYFYKKALLQIKELLTNYGEIGAMWFDCPLTMNESLAKELYDTVKQLQPNCLINSRLGHNLGDFESLGDNMLPTSRLNGSFEAITTLNDTWGYKSFDNNWKKGKDVIEILTQCASKGINYVLNIGPKGDGAFPVESVEVLKELGDFINIAKPAIYDTAASPFLFDLPFGVATQKENKLYFFIKKDYNEDLRFNGVLNEIIEVVILPSKEKVEFSLMQNEFGHYYNIHLSEKDKNQQYIILEATFDGMIQMEKQIIAMPNGELVLPASLASIKSSYNEQSIGQLEKILPDGKRISSGLKMEIGYLGAVENWLKTEDYLIWDVSINSEGFYEITIETTGLYHSAKWLGGHTVILKNNTEISENKITLDEQIFKNSVECYAFGRTNCGFMYFKKGCHSFYCYAKEIKENEKVGLALTSVILRKVDTINDI